MHPPYRSRSFVCSGRVPLQVTHTPSLDDRDVSRCPSTTEVPLSLSSFVNRFSRFRNPLHNESLSSNPPSFSFLSRPTPLSNPRGRSFRLPRRPTEDRETVEDRTGFGREVRVSVEDDLCVSGAGDGRTFPEGHEVTGRTFHKLEP